MIPLSAKEETENRHLRDQLAATQKALQEFVYTVSHDLGAPLRAVNGFSDILQQKYAGSLDEKGLTYLNFIAEGGSKAQLMLVGLLQYSRLQTQAKPPVQTDLDMVLKQVIHELDDKINASHASVRHEALPLISADGDQMRQMFQAVLENALTYHHKDVAPQIDITMEDAGANWVMAVTDNGIGISEENCERVFQIFKRLHADDVYPGVGMGLPVARRIAERHGGTIAMAPAKPCGTVCRITLPKAGLSEPAAGDMSS